MDEETGIFIITEREDWTPEKYMRRLVQEMGRYNEIEIRAQMKCRQTANNIIGELKKLGGWFIEEEGRRIVKIFPKGEEPREVNNYVYIFKREARNRLR